MLSNTWDARRICRFLRLFIVIFCYQSGNKNMLCLALKVGRCVEHPESYLENFKRDNFAVIEGS